jgi:hypothetical protein
VPAVEGVLDHFKTESGQLLVQVPR